MPRDGLAATLNGAARRGRLSRESWLQRFFSTFPGRWPGAGLALLRALVGVTTVVDASAILAGPADATWPIALACGLGLAGSLSLLAGLLTPVAAVSAAASLLFLASAVDESLVTLVVALYLTAVAIAIVLLGPGAWSIDARLFGRREIIFPHTPASRS